MDIREAMIVDIDEMHRIRMAVTENRLSGSARIKLSDKGWVCHIDGHIRGFAFINSSSGNLWALFEEPGYEKPVSPPKSTASRSPRAPPLNERFTAARITNSCLHFHAVSAPLLELFESVLSCLEPLGP